ncbi:Histone-lysine N-methyltransferase [Bertholletia excelsa]
MEMRAGEDVVAGQDLTPPLRPLAFSLYDSSLLSHCSACFSPLPSSTHQSPPSLPSSALSFRNSPKSALLYCSPQCSVFDSGLHFSSAEHHLLLLPNVGEDTSDLRAALRLLHLFEQLDLLSCQNEQPMERIGGLMSNRERLMTCQGEEDGDVLVRVRNGAKAMALARRMRDGLALEYPGDCVLEELALCTVLTNAVEVQFNGGLAIGVAVYGTTFSWINHSCSPNCCYWFSLQKCSGGESPLRICPGTEHGGGCIGGIEMTEKVGKEYGPRIVVRSIKAINKGEEVFVAYTDLLQPKTMRQSELWLKYRFVCSCQRCGAWPLTYVDFALQEIYSGDCSCSTLHSDHNFCRYEAIEKLSDCVDDAITEYLTFGNPKSCCEKLENLLTLGLLDEQFEQKEEKPKQKFWLHPLHHLSLSAYTTLASAYKTYASDLLSLDPERDEIQLEAFDMSRSSTAFSLLLAGATHHLFLSECSLVTSLANFWTSAGESLLNVARSCVWKLFTKRGLPVGELSSFSSYRCCKCSLVDKFERDVSFIEARNSVFEDISGEFIRCITSITPKVWTFLIHQKYYLKQIKDPIDFKWIETMKSSKPNLDKANGEINDLNGEAYTCLNQENVFLYQLGVHCLLYGGFLSSTFCGKQPHLIPYIQSLLCG